MRETGPSGLECAPTVARQNSRADRYSPGSEQASPFLYQSLPGPGSRVWESRLHRKERRRVPQSKRVRALAAVSSPAHRRCSSPALPTRPRGATRSTRRRESRALSRLDRKTRRKGMCRRLLAIRQESPPRTAIVCRRGMPRRASHRSRARCQEMRLCRSIRWWRESPRTGCACDRKSQCQSGKFLD